jgi:hypothetical protein
MKKHKKIIAVDFDGTLCINKFPEIGDPIPYTIERVKEEMAKGTRLILWTCRIGERLTAAVEWCAAQGIRFEAVNENLPDIIKTFNGDTRKVFANEYWDDRAVVTPPDDRQIFLPFATSGSMTVSAGVVTVNANKNGASYQMTGKMCIIECTPEEAARHDKWADASIDGRAKG